METHIKNNLVVGALLINGAFCSSCFAQIYVDKKYNKDCTYCHTNSAPTEKLCNGLPDTTRWPVYEPEYAEIPENNKDAQNQHQGASFNLKNPALVISSFFLIIGTVKISWSIFSNVYQKKIDSSISSIRREVGLQNQAIGLQDAKIDFLKEQIKEMDGNIIIT